MHREGEGGNNKHKEEYNHGNRKQSRERECVDMAIPRQPAVKGMGKGKGQQPRMQPVPAMKQVIRYFYFNISILCSLSLSLCSI